jgi:hypothetical protein
MGIVLLIARLVNYRPGSIMPLMIVMFAVPVVLFEAKVGRDELYYRILQDSYAPGAKGHYQDRLDLNGLVGEIAEIRRESRIAPSSPDQIALEIQLRAGSGQPQAPELLTLISEEFARQQHEAAAAWEAFRRRYPRSRYIPNALYLQGQALDTRIDPEFVVFRGSLYIRYYHDFPWRASQPVWAELYRLAADPGLKAVAALRLAMLEAREGRLEPAIQLLTELTGGPVRAEASSQPSTWSQMLARRPAASSLDLDVDGVVLEGRKLLELLQSNRDPQQDDAALRELLRLDPRDPHYRANLERMLREVPPKSPLRDNLQVLIARSEPSPSRRIEELRSCIEHLSRQSGSDGLPRARFELGIAYQEDKRPEDARAALEQAALLHAGSPWSVEASRRLAAMGAAGRG